MRHLGQFATAIVPPGGQRFCFASVAPSSALFAPPQIRGFSRAVQRSLEGVPAGHLGPVPPIVPSGLAAQCAAPSPSRKPKPKPQECETFSSKPRDIPSVSISSVADGLSRGLPPALKVAEHFAGKSWRLSSEVLMNLWVDVIA